MQRRNICKFVNPNFSETLLVSRFILETDWEIMKKVTPLKYNRLILVVEGDSKLVCDGNVFDMSQGTLFFGFKGEEIFFSHNNGCKFMYIEFDGIRAEELFKRFNISKINRCFRGFGGIVPIWEESLSRASENTIDLVTESMVIYTFSRLNVEVPHQDRVLNIMLQITEEQFNNSELSISEIADELGYNSKYLSHLFKQKVGKNFSEYLRCLRIKYAISLFDNGIDSIKNVALLSGFSDPLYFSTVFKNTLGLSPKEYIKNIKPKSR